MFLFRFFWKYVSILVLMEDVKELRNTLDVRETYWKVSILVLMEDVKEQCLIWGLLTPC